MAKRKGTRFGVDAQVEEECILSGKDYSHGRRTIQLSRGSLASHTRKYQQMVDNLGEASQRQRKNKHNTLHESTILRALYEIADLIL